jgi:hypothetical protein
MSIRENKIGLPTDVAADTVHSDAPTACLGPSNSLFNTHDFLFDAVYIIIGTYGQRTMEGK